MIRFLLVTFFSLTAALADTARPNILVILTDDLGFSDIGCYGAEIETPVLNRLAANGLRFSQFYTTAKCHSSRVSLLSGRWTRQAGDESLARAVILPEVLAPAGYFTANPLFPRLRTDLPVVLSTVAFLTAVASAKEVA